MNKNNFDFESNLVFFLGFFMVQTKIISGINTSLSDLFMVFLIFVYFIKNKLFLEKKYLLFYIVLFIFTLLSTLISSLRFKIEIDSFYFLSNFLKTVTNFLYLQIGYSIYVNKNFDDFKRGLIISSTIISLISLSNYIVFNYFVNNHFFYSSVRMKGLMNDPNYFAITQLVSLVFIFDQIKDKKIRYVLISITLLTVFASGSKTGTLALIIFLLYKYIKVFYIILKSNHNQFFYLLLFVMGIILVLELNLFSTLVLLLEKYIPSLSRVILVFEDLRGAVSAGGSGRSLTWTTAYNIFISSPILGVGIGMYSKISMSEYGVRSIAHNSYLQALSEWGILIFVLFISSIVADLYKSKKTKKNSKVIVDSLIILGLGSLSISLNNSRLLWILIGMLRANAIREENNEIIN